MRTWVSQAMGFFPGVAGTRCNTMQSAVVDEARAALYRASARDGVTRERMFVNIEGKKLLQLLLLLLLTLIISPHLHVSFPRRIFRNTDIVQTESLEFEIGSGLKDDARG